jgi:hypothetical protein
MDNTEIPVDALLIIAKQFKNKPKYASQHKATQDEVRQIPEIVAEFLVREINEWR